MSRHRYPVAGFCILLSLVGLASAGPVQLTGSARAYGEYGWVPGRGAALFLTNTPEVL